MPASKRLSGITETLHGLLKSRENGVINTGMGWKMVGSREQGTSLLDHLVKVIEGL